MIRTQVYLTEEQFLNVQLEAKRHKKPFAQMFRELLNRGLARGLRIRQTN
jgi:hypothetical protein